MAFVKAIAEMDESISAVMMRFPDQGMPLLALAEVLLRTGDCAYSQALSDGRWVARPCSLQQIANPVTFNWPGIPVRILHC